MIYECTVTVSQDYRMIVDADDEWEAKGAAKKLFSESETKIPSGIAYVSRVSAEKSEVND